MQIDQLKKFMKDYNLNTIAYQVLPQFCVEGAVCLYYSNEDQCWFVSLNERGRFLINERFANEEKAIAFFLKKALEDPTIFNDFDGQRIDEFIIQGKKLIKELNL